MYEICFFFSLSSLTIAHMIPKATRYSPYFKKTEKVTVTKQETVTVKEEATVDKGVPDLLDYDLKVLFVGINPGITSGAKGHHYANRTNHFWPCLSESGLVDRKLTFEDDVHTPKLYRLGFTNLTPRTTRRATDLSLAEQREGIPILNSKIEKFRPRIACFVGKGIYEIYSNKKCDQMGLQTDVRIKWLDRDGETLIFVMPSTSGLVTAYKKPDRIRQVLLVLLSIH